MKRALFVAVALCGSLGGCASADPEVHTSGSDIVAPRRADGTIIDDRTLCNYKGRKDIEVAETAGPGAIQPNVRRVYRVWGLGADRRKVLVCREVDTNLDGYKDVARTYSDEGQAKKEIADTNYDGKIDTWNLFAQGRLAEVHMDHNYDGEPDEWKIYSEGKLIRVRRDSNYDKRADVWEMYRKGRLERMGVDVDGDERVDRWDHDSAWRKQMEAEEEKKQLEEDKKKQEELDRRNEEAIEDAEAADAAANEKMAKEKAAKDKPAPQPK
jgi:hypothetical protein